MRRGLRAKRKGGLARIDHFWWASSALVSNKQPAAIQQMALILLLYGYLPLRPLPPRSRLRTCPGSSPFMCMSLVKVKAVVTVRIIRDHSHSHSGLRKSAWIGLEVVSRYLIIGRATGIAEMDSRGVGKGCRQWQAGEGVCRRLDSTRHDTTRYDTDASACSCCISISVVCAVRYEA